MAWDRTNRTEAILREKVAIIVLERLNDPRLGFVTITGARLSGDKRHCKIFYTVLGTPTQRRLSEHALRDAAPHIQEVLAPTLRLRTIPELRFVYDESIAKATPIKHMGRRSRRHSCRRSHVSAAGSRPHRPCPDAVHRGSRSHSAVPRLPTTAEVDGRRAGRAQTPHQTDRTRGSNRRFGGWNRWVCYCNEPCLPRRSRKQRSALLGSSSAHFRLPPNADTVSV